MSQMQPLERSGQRETQNQRFYDQMTNQNIQRAGSIGQIFVDNYVKGQQLEMQGDEQVARMAERRIRFTTEMLRQKQMQQQIASYESELRLRQGVAQTRMLESQSKIAVAEAEERRKEMDSRARSDYYKNRNKIDAYKGQIGSMWEEDGKVMTLVPSPGQPGRFYRRQEVKDKARIEAWRQGRIGGGGSSSSYNPALLDRRDSATLKVLSEQIDLADDGPVKDKLIAIRDKVLSRISGSRDSGNSNYNSVFNALPEKAKDAVMQIRQQYPGLTEEETLKILRETGYIK